MDNSFRKIFSYFKHNYIRIVYEAGLGCFDLYKRLTAYDIESIVTSQSLIPPERVETDTKMELCHHNPLFLEHEV